MADVWEKDLSNKASLTAYDFLRVVGSDNVSYKQDMYSSQRALMAAMPRLTSSNDLNDVLTAGIYYTADANLPANAPTADAYNSTIVVLNARGGADVFQIYFCNNKNLRFFRAKFGDTWRSWAQLPTNAEVNALKPYAVKYENVEITNGYCQTTYPTGYDYNDIVIIQPEYNNASIMGWTPVIQRQGGTLTIYVRQGTVTPANGSKISFRAIFSKAQ